VRLRLFLFCILAARLVAQEDPSAVLQRVREKVGQTLDRLPRYMCTQVTERSQSVANKDTPTYTCDALNALRQKQPFRMALESVDRIRLDVAVGGASGEMYSWAGDNRFSQARLSDLVAHGTTQSGTYYSFLKMIFRSDSAAIAYRGTVDEDHRSLLEFAFDVRRETSHWVLVYRNHEDDAKVLPYRGTFLADPTTGDLVRLEVHGIDFPKSLYECEISNSFHFERTRVPGGDLLLPVESRLKMVDVSGREFENNTVYLGCHEFLGQSTIRFGPPGDPLPAGRTEVAEPTPVIGVATPSLPAGLEFAVGFTQDLDLETAAGGDRLPARLACDLKDSSSTVLAHRGTAVTARLVGLTHGTLYLTVRVSIRLETLEADGVSIPLPAVPKCGDPMAGDLRAPSSVCVPHRDDPYVVQLVFVNNAHRKLPAAALRTTWVTAAPR
jgi:hypothetical protein